MVKHVVGEDCATWRHPNSSRSRQSMGIIQNNTLFVGVSNLFLFLFKNK
jgi:hypothetical protein